MSATTAVAAPSYGFGDELASSIIHGIGILLSIAGLVIAVAIAARYADARAVTACAIYGSSLVLLYTASTLYHTIPGVSAKRLLRTFDHIAIFLLIAGTYTPFTLIALPGVWGWSLFGAIWILAAAGSTLELGVLQPAVMKHSRKLSVLMYIGMGWVGMIAFKPLSEHLQAGGMTLLLAGGAAYTLGVPFYLARRLPYHHALWHLFVLAGSVLHFMAVVLYVIPGRS